ncbi:MAG TPA: hypothetical protein VMR62_21220 [Bryobacteraceae bacterium]|jgi:molybdenum-dependent DNA-binding transcriptional regulator ModE|nr:hypothetical protein [Bryobacteraceae bacterium]
MAHSGMNTFTTYLEEKHRWETQKQSPVAGGTAFSILAAVAESGGRSSLTDAQAASGMSFTNFAEAVKRLQDLGYIIIEGVPGSEAVQLTQLGSDVASLTRNPA